MSKYYVINRWDVLLQMDFLIVSVTPGNNPLYGHGSWDLFSGPFDTLDEAKESIPEEIITWEATHAK